MADQNINIITDSLSGAFAEEEEKESKGDVVMKAAKSDTLTNYQIWSRRTIKYPGSRIDSENKGVNPIGTAYTTLGLNGEAGEVAERIKKSIRDGNLDLTETAYELGDVLYYTVRVCDELGLDATKVLKANVDKLEKRMREGTIQGSGSNR